MTDFPANGGSESHGRGFGVAATWFRNHPIPDRRRFPLADQAIAKPHGMRNSLNNT
jgi:hypothetical protein